MGEQRGFGFDETQQERHDGWAVPDAKQRTPEPYEPYPKGKALEPNDEVTLIHRLGRTKRVRFAQVIGPRIHLIWPVANEPLELSAKSGRVLSPRSLSEWRLEPNALEMARVARDMFKLERKIAVE